MAKVISITDVAELKPTLNGVEIRKFGADGIIVVIRKDPGSLYFNAPIWYDTDGNIVHSRTHDADVKDELISNFWVLGDNEELHEYISPERMTGFTEIRMKE